MIWTRPPANSADLSGEYVFATCTLFDQRGGEQVERHDLLVRLGGRDDGAAQRGVAVAFAEAADEHVLVADHRQAGDALHRLGRVRIPVGPHLLRAHVVGDDLGVLALGQLRLGRRRGGVQRLTSHGHVFAVAGHGQRHVDRGPRVLDDLDRDQALAVSLHRHLELVAAGRKVDLVAAVDVGVDGRLRPDDLDRHAGQGNGVLLVADGADDAHRAAGCGVRRLLGERGSLRKACRQDEGEQGRAENRASHTLLEWGIGWRARWVAGGRRRKRRQPMNPG